MQPTHTHHTTFNGRPAVLTIGNGVLEVRADDNSYCKIDSGHYAKVYAARKSALSSSELCKIAEINTLRDHPLVGKELVHNPSGKTYVVESVTRQWFLGPFLTALVRVGKSHGTVVVDALSNLDPNVHESVAQFQRDYLMPA